MAEWSVSAVILGGVSLLGFALGASCPRIGLGLLFAGVVVSSSIPWQLGTTNVAHPLFYLVGFLIGALVTRQVQGPGGFPENDSPTCGACALANLLAVGVVSATVIAVAANHPVTTSAFVIHTRSRITQLALFDPSGLPGIVQAGLITASGFLLFSLIVRTAQSSEHRREIDRAVAAGLVIAIAWCVVQIVALDPTVRPDKGVFDSEGWVGSFQDSHSFAAYLVLTCCLVLGLGTAEWWNNRRPLSIVYWIVGAASLLVLFFTNSRTGLLMAVVGFSLFIGITWTLLGGRGNRLDIRRRATIAGITATLLVLAALGLTSSQGLRTIAYGTLSQLGNERMWEPLHPEGPENPLRMATLARRVLLWNKAKNLIARSPIFGTGPQGFRDTFIDLREATYRDYAAEFGEEEFERAREELHTENAHAYFLQFASEFGLPLTVSFVSLLGLILITILRGASVAATATCIRLMGAFSGLAAFLGFCLLAHPLLLLELQAVFWGVAGVAYGRARTLSVVGHNTGLWRQILRGLLVVLVAVSVGRLTWAILGGGPRVYDAGFHDWEVENLDGEEVPFRWTNGTNAWLLRTIDKPVLRARYYISRPDLPGALVPVSLRLNDELLDERTLRTNGWTEVMVYLPSILGEERWTETTRALENGTLPPSAWLHLVAHETFVPSRLAAVDDTRELGVGFGEIEFSDELPGGELGLHKTEIDADGVAYRWTGARASMSVAIRGREAILSLRSDHPDIESHPVGVRILWGAGKAHEVHLQTSDWTEFSVPAPDTTERAVLTLIVDRTWIPARELGTSDGRELGVGLQPVRWAQ